MTSEQPISDPLDEAQEVLRRRLTRGPSSSDLFHVVQGIAIPYIAMREISIAFSGFLYAMLTMVVFMVPYLIWHWTTRESIRRFILSDELQAIRLTGLTDRQIIQVVSERLYNSLLILFISTIVVSVVFDVWFMTLAVFAVLLHLLSRLVALSSLESSENAAVLQAVVRVEQLVKFGAVASLLRMLAMVVLNSLLAVLTVGIIVGFIAFLMSLSPMQSGFSLVLGTIVAFTLFVVLLFVYCQIAYRYHLRGYSSLGDPLEPNMRDLLDRAAER